jgi:hypothetical protein
MGTISIYDPQDKFSLVRHLLVWLVWAVPHSAWREIIGIDRVFSAEAADLDWTIYRVGGLWNGEEGSVATTYVGHRMWSSSISRSEISAWLVDQAGKAIAEYVHQNPAIFSAKEI